MLEIAREANKIINNLQGEREVYNVDLYLYKKHIGATTSMHCGSSVV
jgi:glucose-6-phosphate 1-dehydrogenase